MGNIDIIQLRPARYIARDKVVTPYSPQKAIGNALLLVSADTSVASLLTPVQDTDEGKFTDKDFYVGHLEVSKKPPKFLIVTDRYDDITVM